MGELEIRLHVELGRRGRLLDALDRRKLRQSTLSAIYFDTSDQLLARHRFALRLCSEDGRWVQTLERSGGRAAERLEHEVAVDLDPAVEGAEPAVPELDLDRHKHSAVGRRLQALLRRAARPALAESCRTDVTRLSRLLSAHGALVEWSLDEGEVTAAGRSRPISELELEFKQGDPAGLYALALDWQALQGLWIDPMSKFERGALLLADSPFAPAAKAAPPPWGGKELRALGGETMLRRMVASCLAQILANAGEIARGSPDAEHVHQLRVGLRRLRSVACGTKCFAARMPDGWEAAIEPVFAALGESRDRHVLSTSVTPALQRAGAPVPDAVPPSPADAKAIQDLVRGAALQGVLIRLMAFAGASSAGLDRADDDSGLACLVRRLRKLARQVTRDARHFEQLPFARRHRVRKRIKRLRYLAEFAAPAFHRRDVDAWLKRIAPAQDHLGKYIDDVQAGLRFAALAPTEPGACFALAWLRAQSERSARASRKSLERLRRSKVFWVRARCA